MGAAEDVLTSAIERLKACVAGGDKDAITREVESLIQLVVGAIATSQTDVLQRVTPNIEKLYSTTVVQGDSDRDDSVVGQLGTLVSLFAAGASRPDKAIVGQLTSEGVCSKIMDALAQASGPLDNSELAKAVRCADATVARALIQLRNSGLTVGKREWRRKLNELTPFGREQLALRKSNSRPTEDESSYAKMVADAIQSTRSTSPRLYADVMKRAQYLIDEQRALSHEMARVGTNRAHNRRTLFRNIVTSGKPTAFDPANYERLFEAVALPECVLLQDVQMGKGVHELASEFGVRNKDIVKRLKTIGVHTQEYRVAKSTE